MGKDEYEEVANQPPFRFEKEGDSVEGKLLKVRDGQFSSKVYDLDTEDGQLTVFGSRVMDRLMAGISEGTNVKIEYNGEQRLPGGKRLKLFKVYKKK